MPARDVRFFQCYFSDVDDDRLSRVGRLVLGLGGHDRHRIALKSDATRRQDWPALGGFGAEVGHERIGQRQIRRRPGANHARH